MKLPDPDLKGGISLESALVSRSTIREFNDKALSQAQLTKLLWAAQGIRSANKRTAPSAKEQYPLNLYVNANNIQDMPVGSYHYTSRSHSLALQQSGRLAAQTEKTAFDSQPWVGKAALQIIITANIESMRQTFASQPPVGKRGEWYCYIETGAVAQNLHLQATTLGLGMVLVGGFDNHKLSDCLSLPTEQVPTALICIGSHN